MGLWAFLKRVLGGAPESKPEVIDFNALREQWKGEVLEQLREHEERKRVFAEKMATINIAKPVERFKAVPDVSPFDLSGPWNPDYDPRFRFHRDGDHWIWDGAFANRNQERGRVPTLRVRNADGTLGDETTAPRYAYERTFGVKLDKGQGRVVRICGMADCVNPHHMTLKAKKCADADSSVPPIKVGEPHTVPLQTEIKLRMRTTLSAVLREAKQKITEESGGCLRWNGAFTPPHSNDAPRHAVMGFNSKVFRIRRIMYMVAHGLNFSTKDQVPQYVAASCGNWWCVAPKHMRGWTQEEKDAAAARARTGLKWHKDNGHSGHDGQNGDVPVVHVPEGKHRPVTVIAGVGVLDHKKT